MINSDKKRVIFFNSNKVWGGGEKWHFNMAKELKDLGHRVSLITYPESELEQKAKEQGIETFSLAVGNLSFLNPFTKSHLRLYLKTEHVDALVMNLPSDVKLAAPAAKKARVQKVIYRRGMPKDLKNNVLNKYVFSKVDLFIANSEEIKRTITKNLPELAKKTTILFNGVKPIENKEVPLNSPIVLGSMGRLVEQKGQRFLIEVAKNLKDKNFDFRMQIAGKGPLEGELRSMINRYDLNKEVELVGHVNAADFFPKIDIFVFPSLFEGSANALIESHLYQRPAIAWDISSNPEVIENEKSGFLIEKFNTNLMAEKVIELNSNQEKYREIQRVSKELVNTKFNYHHKVKEFEGLL